jgi:hypothetical protein
MVVDHENFGSRRPELESLSFGPMDVNLGLFGDLFKHFTLVVDSFIGYTFIHLHSIHNLVAARESLRMPDDSRICV